MKTSIEPTAAGRWAVMINGVSHGEFVSKHAANTAMTKYIDGPAHGNPYPDGRYNTPRVTMPTISLSIVISVAIALVLMTRNGCAEEFPESAGQSRHWTSFHVADPVNNRSGIRVGSRPSRSGVQDAPSAIGTRIGAGKARLCNRPQPSHLTALPHDRGHSSGTIQSRPFPARTVKVIGKCDPASSPPRPMRLPAGIVGLCLGNCARACQRSSSCGASIVRDDSVRWNGSQEEQAALRAQGCKPWGLS